MNQEAGETGPSFTSESMLLGVGVESKGAATV